MSSGPSAALEMPYYRVVDGVDQDIATISQPRLGDRSYGEDYARFSGSMHFAGDDVLESETHLICSPTDNQAEPWSPSARLRRMPILGLATGVHDTDFAIVQSDDYSVDDWVSQPLRSIGNPFLDTIVRGLEDDLSEIGDLARKATVAAAAGHCRVIARSIAAAIEQQTDLRYAAFVEESARVSLVVQSLATERRVSFTVDGYDLYANAHRIDEQTRVETAEISILDCATLKEWIEWLVTQV